MERPIAYEPHPVSPERKAELMAQGYRIIDAKFAPKDAKPVITKVVTEVVDDSAEVEAFIDAAFDDINEVTEAPKPRRGRRKKAI